MSSSKKSTKQATRTAKATKAAPKAKPATPNAKAVKATEPKVAPVVAEAPAQPETKAKAKPAPTDKPLSCLDAAVVVLRGNGGTPMGCKDLIAVMKGKGLWDSTAPTPHATLSAAILRERQHKGEKSRFAKAGRGLFTLSDHAKNA